MTNKKPYKSTSPRGLLTCKALISSYNFDIIILFVLRFMPRSLNYIPARLTLADFAMFFAIEIITCRTNNVFAKPSSSLFFDNIILCSTQKNFPLSGKIQLNNKKQNEINELIYLIYSSFNII